MSLPHTRQSLLLRLRRRSSDAWSEFLEIYELAIYDYCRRRGLQDADARDVTQEVLAVVGDKVEQWKDDPSAGKFRGWLFRVAHNIAVDKFVEQSKRAGIGGDFQIPEGQLLTGKSSAGDCAPGDSAELQSTAFRREYRRKLMHWAADQIRPTVKEASWKSFWLTAIEGNTPESVAAQLGLSVGSVYASKFRIIARLRQTVRKFDAQDEFEESLREDFRQS